MEHRQRALLGYLMVRMMMMVVLVVVLALESVPEMVKVQARVLEKGTEKVSGVLQVEAWVHPSWKEERWF